MREDLIILGAAIVLVNGAALHVAMLERRARRLLDEPASDIPDVADSPVFSPSLRAPDGPTALARVLAQGDMVRRCMACESPKTNLVTTHYRRLDSGASVPVVRVTCLECDNVDEGWIKPADHAAAYALEAWNTTQLAQVAFAASDDDTMDEDLRELDR